MEGGSLFSRIPDSSCIWLPVFMDSWCRTGGLLSPMVCNYDVPEICDLMPNSGSSERFDAAIPEAKNGRAYKPQEAQQVNVIAGRPSITVSGNYLTLPYEVTGAPQSLMPSQSTNSTQNAFSGGIGTDVSESLLYEELWHAYAGPLVTLPRIG